MRLECIYPFNLIEDCFTYYAELYKEEKENPLNVSLLKFTECMQSIIGERNIAIIEALYVQGKSNKEVGEMFGITGGRVGQIKSICLGKLHSKRDMYTCCSMADYKKALCDKEEIELRLENIKKTFDLAAEFGVELKDSSELEELCNILFSDIRSVGLTSRSSNALYWDGNISCLYDLIRNHSLGFVSNLINIGQLSLKDIEDKIGGLGFKLRD